ncbi:hypothetical protein [Paenimyroides aestuarii]|uniref:Lipocalin-like domain-containing protein n=1 Tax=Paenimyroides aestuarii TaxID=2968490 RepID=A0ABY5NRL2_9FLAO|nr:hypothetical protein [Paenimyroides aestuarii]UUV21203.1 hypothetical protein NPX36_12875 [Paenimyroides aestuarii]
MKKIIVTLVVALSFVACNDDDQAVDVLVGKWFPEAVIINGESQPYQGNANCGKDYLQLNEFNSFEIGDYTQSDAEPPTTPVDPCPIQKFYGSYTVVDNELKLNGSNFFQGGTIIEKSASKLQLKRMIDVDGDGTDDEVIEVFVK